MRDADPTPVAAMSIDVEDWFQVENLRGAIDPASWDAQPLRVERNTRLILDLLAARDIRATFFVLGWVAERRPQIVRDIVAEGHELACHGYGHDLLTRLGPATFRADVLRAKRLLEDIGGVVVDGYRAPCFSITDWAIEVLAEVGFRYDSSAFPVVAHDRYGKLSGLDDGEPITQLRPGFHEVCVSVLRCGGRGLPWGGGGYFRLMPYRLFHAGVERILGSGRPYVFYTHPWEFDPEQPRVGGMSRSARFRHYVNLHRTAARYERLLGDFDWRPIRDLLPQSALALAA